MQSQNQMSQQPKVPTDDIHMQALIDKYKKAQGPWNEETIHDFVNDLFKKPADGPRLEGKSLKQLKSLRDELSQTFHG